MVDLDKIISEKYYAVNHDLEYLPIGNEPPKPYNPHFLLIKEIYGSWQNFQYTNFTYRFELFDIKGEQIFNICENDWQIDNLRIYGYNYGGNHVHFRIVDPLGRVMDKDFGNRMSGIINAIKFLREISQYRSLEHYTLTDENNRLKAELEALQLEHQNLTTRLQTLKN